MKMCVFACAVLCALPSAVLAKDWKLTLLPADGQEVLYEDGRQAVRSDRPAASGAKLLITSERFGLKQTPSFVLSVKSYRSEPANFTIGNVVASTDVGGVAVVSISDIEADARAVEKRAKQAAMWQALAVGLQAGAAGMSQTSTYRATTFSPYGTRSTYGTVTTPGNPAASSAILANGQSQIANTMDRGRAQADALAESAEFRGFRPSTIEPEGEATTPLTLTALPKKATSLRVDVTLNGEIHSFAFALGQVK